MIVVLPERFRRPATTTPNSSNSREGSRRPDSKVETGIKVPKITKLEEEAPVVGRLGFGIILGQLLRLQHHI